jgi:hypothetical protein
MKRAYLLIISCLLFYVVCSQNKNQANDLTILTKYQKISIGLAIFSSTLIFVGFYLTIYSLRKNHDWNRRSKSIDSLSISTDSSRIIDLELLNQAFNYSQSNEPISLKTIEEKIKDNPKLLQILFVRLNIFELYALGIHQGVYDESFLHDAIWTVMTRAYFRFKLFIIKHREHNADYCSNLESLVLKWEAEKKNIKKRKKTA